MQARRQSKPSAKTKIATLGIVLLGVVGLVGYVIYDRTSSGQVSVVADPNFTGGTEREIGQSSGRSGSIAPVEHSDTGVHREPVLSESGVISVYQPMQDQLVQSGDVLTGRSSLDTVWYRLIDDRIGVIADGTLPVIDGMFSGEFNFETGGTEGRLDIFSLTGDGREVENIEIDIRFKQ